MNIRKLIASIMAFAGLALLLAGCGGSGITPINQFAGERNAQLGTLDHVAVAVMNTAVDASGNITGATINGGGVGMLPAGRPVTGKIDGDGRIVINVGKFTLTGTIQLVDKVRGSASLYASGELHDQNDPGQVLRFEWWQDDVH